MIKPRLNQEIADLIQFEEELFEEQEEVILLGPDGLPYAEDKLYIWPWETWIDQRVDHKDFKPPKYYGPTAKQFTAWVEDTKEHDHDLDVRIWMGATRSGKSLGAIGRIVYLSYLYPGVAFLVCGTDYEYLRTSLIEVPGGYRSVLTLPGQEFYSHPFVKRGADKYHKQIDFANGSTIYFRNIDDDLTKVLGQGVEGVHLEQPELFKDFDAVLDLVTTRMSGKKMPRRFIFMTSNPFANLEALERRFNLDQFDPDYDGPPRPIGKPCYCHTCNACFARNLEVEWVGNKCPKCGHEKENKCSGRQQFQWVVHCRPEDNPNVPTTYHQDQKALMGEDKYETLSKGVIRAVGKGKCYPNFSMTNLIASDPQIKLDRDLYWTHDFNNHPMSSCMWQKDDPKQDKFPDLTVFDEICKYGATAKMVADAFVDKYGHMATEFTGWVRLNGDPMGRTGQNMIDNRYIQIKKILEKAGFRVIIDVLPTWYKIALRIETVNFFLKDGEKSRIKICRKKCPHLVKSLDQITWSKNGKEEDKSFDTRATKSKQYHLVHAMTHMAAALGYSLHRHWPALGVDRNNAMIVNVDQGTVTEFDEQGDAVHRNITAEELRELGGVDEDMKGTNYDFESLEQWETYSSGPKRKKYTVAGDLRERGVLRLKPREP